MTTRSSSMPQRFNASSTRAGFLSPVDRSTWCVRRKMGLPSCRQEPRPRVRISRRNTLMVSLLFSLGLRMRRPISPISRDAWKRWGGILTTAVSCLAPSRLLVKRRMKRGRSKTSTTVSCPLTPAWRSYPHTSITTSLRFPSMPRWWSAPSPSCSA